MVQSYKNESKSQLVSLTNGLSKAVMYGTKLQKWEQITTVTPTDGSNNPLWCMVQSYKNESKSQPQKSYLCDRISCDVWYKVTKMRANHNTIQFNRCVVIAVMYGTKLQKWEQITTSSTESRSARLLWCMVQSYKNESKSQHDTA